MIKPIVQLREAEFHRPDVFLRRPSSVIPCSDSSIRKTIIDLIDTLNYHKIAVGLSAIQIGVAKRICVVDVQKIADILHDAKPAGGILVLVNPKLMFASKRRTRAMESCMSFPLFAGAVERPWRISLVYQDENRIERRLNAKGILARILLHELDHLDGILLIDQMMPTDQLIKVEYPLDSGLTEDNIPT